MDQILHIAQNMIYNWKNTIYSALIYAPQIALTHSFKMSLTYKLQHKAILSRFKKLKQLIFTAHKMHKTQP